MASNPPTSKAEQDKADVKARAQARPSQEAAFYRAANEDDDGYDPYSDRPAPREPLFERDPWA